MLKEIIIDSFFFGNLNGCINVIRISLCIGLAGGTFVLGQEKKKEETYVLIQGNLCHQLTELMIFEHNWKNDYHLHKLIKIFG